MKKRTRFYILWNSHSNFQYHLDLLLALVIPFLKTYVNLPAAIAFTGLYAKMTDSMELKNVFYALVVPFLIFFASFALFIYPNRALVHPHALVDFLASKLPANFGAPLAIVRNWSFALFYVMAEMWGSVVASLLFWGFANEVTTVDEAKKYCTCLWLCTSFPSMLHHCIESHGCRLLLSCYRPTLWPWSQRRSHLLGSIC